MIWHTSAHYEQRPALPMLEVFSLQLLGPDSYADEIPLQIIQHDLCFIQQGPRPRQYNFIDWMPAMLAYLLSTGDA